MNELTFTTYEELMAWLESRKDEREKLYYYGDIECFNGELYTIENIMHDAEPAWFKDGGVCEIYEFEEKTFYAVLSERQDDYNIEVVKTAKEAVKRAGDNWDYLTEDEKRSPKVRPHESAIIASAYIERQIIEGYDPIWTDGEFVDPTEYDKCSSFNENSREMARIIRECMEGRR